MRRAVVYSSSPRLFYQESHLNNLLGTLVREGESHDRRLQTVEQLREWLKQIDPSKVNPKIVPKLTNAICRAFVWRQKDLRVELVECIRLMGKNLGELIPLFFHNLRLAIDFDGQNSEQQHRFNTQYPGVPELTEEEKLFIMKPAAEIVQFFASSKQEVLPNVFPEMSLLLSHANSPEMYVAVIGMFASVLPQFSEIMAPFFHDAVDVSIGWYITAAQRRDLIRRETERFLLLLHPLWNVNQNAVVDFLVQFSEDMEKSCQTYSSQRKAETLDEILTFLDIFKIVCDAFSGGRVQANSSISLDHAAAILNRLMIEPSAICSPKDHQRVQRSAFSSIASFVSILPGVLLCEQTDLHKYILAHLQSLERGVHISSSVTFLKLIARVVRVVGSHPLPDFLLPLLSPSSPLISVLPFGDNSELVEADVGIMHAVFSSKQVAVVTQIYSQLVERMKQAFFELAHSDRGHTIRAERQILFGLAALRKIATDKMDLFGVHLFTPTIFDLLSRDIRPFGGPSGLESAQKLATNSGFIQAAIFSLLVGHMQGHSYFVANSELVDNGNRQQDTAKRTSKYLAKFISELAQVLSTDAEYVDPAVRLLALTATTEVITQIIIYRPSLLRNEIISRLLDAVVRSTANEDRDALLCAINCLSSLFPYAKFISRRLFVELFEICLLHIGSSDEAVANRALNLVEQLAVSLQTAHLLEENALPSVAEEVQSDEASLQSPFSSVLMAFSYQFRYSSFQSRTVSPAMFSTLISYLLQASNTRPKLTSMLDVHSFTAPNGTQPVSPRFYFIAWLTALCDIASHCVVSKLKTPLGKPQDTLLALELQLKKLAEEATASSSSQSKSLTLSSATTFLDQNRRLLDLLDHLERGMYNAFEGTAIVSAPPPKMIRTFFATNRATCEEWLGRIRLSALTAAWSSGAYEAAIRHGMEMLSDWRRLGAAHAYEVKQHLVPVAVCLTRCFCKLRCPALISGLYVWCIETCGRKLSWLKPAVTFCAERYELCINQCSQRLDDYIPSDSTRVEQQTLSDRIAIVEFLLKLSVDCFDALHDWDAYETWREGVTQRLRDSDVERVGSEIFAAPYLRDIASLHSFSFAHLVSSEGSAAAKQDMAPVGWGFEDVIRSVRQQNIRLVALISENSQQNSPASNLESQSLAIRDTISQLIKVSTSSSGLPSVACLRDLATALMENRLTNNKNQTNAKSFNISLMASLCDDFFASNIAPDTSAFGGAKMNEQLSLKSVIDVITMTKIRQHLSETYDCGDHCLVNAVAVRLARKQGLSGFASKLLVSQLQNHVYLIGGDIPQETAEGCIEQLAQMPMDLIRTKCRSVFTLRCEYVKLFRDSGKSMDAADAALSFALSALNLSSGNSNQSHQLVNSCCAKQLLLIAKWLQSDSEFANSLTSVLTRTSGQQQQQQVRASLSERLILLKQLMDRSLPLSKLSLGHVMNPTEHLIGQLLAMAANQSPTSSKAWMQLAGWCHFWGRKAIVDASQNGLQLSEEEYRTVVGCLPPSISADQTAFNGIVKIITKLDAPVSASGAPADMSESSNTSDSRDSDYRRDSSVIEQQIIAVCPMLAQAPEARGVLLAVWRAARQRLFILYNMAAVAYFSFVNLNPQITEQTALASLRLLRLLAKHAWELETILANGLQQSPVGPWRAIIPQLFARLGHPEPYVRRAIAELLCRIAMTAPHEIVYPAVAGFYAYGGSVLTIGVSRSSNQSSPSPSPSPSPAQLVSRSQQQQSDDLKACYSHLVEALAAQNASLVSQVCDFVSELTRIAVLWDELVLNILAAHHSAISRRFSQLNDELATTFAAVERHHLTKTEGNTIAHWKYALYMKPVLALFESVRKLTSSRQPETDHERWFSTTLLPIIDSTIEALHRPRQLGKSARHSQLIVKQLLTALQQGSAGLQAAGAALNLEFMSPLLVGEKFKDAAIPLPGNKVTLYAVEPQIFILPTKTKPKKISFIGSDGKTYSYLLKGIEDLHLDERMMQLLRLVNTTFTEQPGFRARNYAVTPLGRRSGLIQWVDGITPAFTVYKRWQQRSAARAASDGANVQIPRPADLYFSVTSALLKKAGVSVETRRDKIPTAIQRRALEQLVTDTPGDLLARELWSSCVNSPDWFRKLSAFNKSVATMSIVGYIIGLGDRHLDNILIDLARAEVVHIDYNVCFEKGLRLRIPERVPFRMSQNVERALGVFGCEGLFRSACEYVMNQLRKSREVLLTLLEAFIYDPLIDWTVSNNADDSADVGSLDHLLPRSVVIELHKGVVPQDDSSNAGTIGDGDNICAVSAPKFPFRADYGACLINVLVKLAEQKEDIKTLHSSLMDTLNDFCEVLKVAEVATGEHRKLEARIAILRQCWQFATDSVSRQQLATLPQRTQALSVVETERCAVMQTLTAVKSEETEKQTVTTKAAAVLKDGNTNGVSTVLSPVVDHVKKISLSRLTASVFDFLNSTGQTQLLSQFEALEKDLDLEVVSKLTDTFVPLVTDALQFFSNRASRYFSPNSQLFSTGVLYELEKISPSKDKALPDKQSVADVITQLTNERASVEPWSSADTVCAKWVALRSAVAEATEAKTTVGKTDTAASSAALQDALASLRSENQLCVDLQGNPVVSGSVSSAAAFCYMVLDWLAPRPKPLNQWLQLPAEDDRCGVFLPNTIIEFLLAIIHTIGDDLRPTMPAESCQLLDLATRTLTQLHSFSLALIEASFAFVSTLVPKFYSVILARENFDLVKALRSGKADELQWYVESLLTSSDDSDLTSCAQQIAAKLTTALSELSEEGSLNPAIYSRLFISRAILFADSLVCHTVGRFSAFQYEENLASIPNIFIELRNCFEKLFLDDKNGLGRGIVKVTWQLLAAFLGMVNFPFDYNSEQPLLPPDIRLALPSLFMLDEQVAFPFAVNLFDRFKATFLSSKALKFGEFSAAFNRSNLATLQYAVAAFEWYNGDLIPDNEDMIQPTFSVVCRRVDEASQYLNAIQTQAASCQNRFNELCSKVMQRLKWAVGANPDLNEIINRFAEEKDKVDSALSDQQRWFTQMSDLVRGCNLIQDDRSSARQVAMLSLISSIAEAINRLCDLSANSPQLSDEETMFIESFPVPQNGGPSWIDDIIPLISRAVSAEEHRIVELNDARRKSIEGVNSRGGGVRRGLKLLFDISSSVSTSIQTLKRIEEVHGTAITDEQPSFFYFSNVHAAVSAFVEHATIFQRLDNLSAIADPQLFVNVQKAAAHAVEVLSGVSVYATEALSRAHKAEDPYVALESYIEKWFAERIERRISPVSGSLQQLKQTKQQPPQSQQQQAWNQQALQVWQRVRAKLDGRDSSNKEVRLTVTDHVSVLIAQSRDTDNLAAMYEGWTPWV